MGTTRSPSTSRSIKLTKATKGADQVFQQRLSAVKLATAQARAVAAALPDEAQNLSEALIRLVQEKAFDMLMHANGDAEDFSLLANIACATSYASINLQEFREKIGKKARATAKRVTQQMQSAGLSASTVQQIRQQILGIADAE